MSDRKTPSRRPGFFANPTTLDPISPVESIAYCTDETFTAPCSTSDELIRHGFNIVGGLSFDSGPRPYPNKAGSVMVQTPDAPNEWKQAVWVYEGSPAIETREYRVRVGLMALPSQTAALASVTLTFADGSEVKYTGDEITVSAVRGPYAPRNAPADALPLAPHRDPAPVQQEITFT